jgi:tetratricopeptide (TPR) repeat protein
MLRGVGRIASLVLTWIATTSAANADDPAPEEFGEYEGPDHVKVDLLRPGKTPGSRQRIYVQARFPDGELGMFLVDSGADISVISESVAERLKLPIQRDWGVAEGLSGVASLHRAVLPTLELGAAKLRDVEVAVGVRGVQDTVGVLPLAGILGTNVWQRFVMEIDYPADLLVLHRPGTQAPPRSSGPMWYEGHRVYVPVGLWTKSDPPHRGEIVIQVDTGAGGLLMMGSGNLNFDGAKPDEKLYTEGLEPIFGLGAADTLPSSAFLKTTRRIPLERVEFGGKTHELDIQAQWMDWDAPPGSMMSGLAGHEMMDGHRVFFDFQGGRFSVSRSHRAPRKIDGHAVMLAQDLARYGADDPSRSLFRAKMHAALEHYDQSDALLVSYLGSHPADGEARVLLANVRRFRGDLAGAWEALRPIRPADLVAEGEIVGAVNGLLLEGRLDEALQLADAAIAAYDQRPRPPAERSGKPEEYDGLSMSAAHVARADALFAAKRFADAKLALLESGKLADNPDSHLLRRARVALATGDRYGAMAHMRQLLQLYPTNGQYLWFYATLVAGPADAATFRHDLQDAIGRLHETALPLDYLVVSHHLLGEESDAAQRMKEGVDRDCLAPRTPRPDRDNCTAWYRAMAGTDLDAALHQIESALAANGPRSDYLDTKAMVLLSRGDYQRAADTARLAARMSPDDIYMLWQAERIAQLADSHRPGKQ